MALLARKASPPSTGGAVNERLDLLCRAGLDARLGGKHLGCVVGACGEGRVVQDAPDGGGDVGGRRTAGDLDAGGQAQHTAGVGALVAPADDAASWEKVMTPDVREALADALEALRAADGFDPASIEAALRPVAERSGRTARAVYQPIRVAITGTTVSPGIFDSLAALGREQSLLRIEQALNRLGQGDQPL